MAAAASDVAAFARHLARDRSRYIRTMAFIRGTGPEGPVSGAARGVRPGEVIVVGHTADDQAETVLFNVARGAGPPWRGGNPTARRGSIVRPLLAVERQEIEAFAAAIGLPVRRRSCQRRCSATPATGFAPTCSLLEEAVGGRVVAGLARSGRRSSYEHDLMLSAAVAEVRAVRRGDTSPASSGRARSLPVRLDARRPWRRS